MAMKTNALRQLDKRKIPYETREYSVEDENFDGKLIPAKLGLSPDMVFKTLVLRDDRGGYLVCVIPVERELDLKAVARLSGHKSVSMLLLKELLPLTGYVRGGCSPLGMKKAFPTFVDSAAEAQPRLSVSAGARGCQVLLATADLLRETSATLGHLCEE